VTRPTSAIAAVHDRRELPGPFDLIGDVHGCREELEDLLATLGWVLTEGADGRAESARHPGDRTAIFLGDLVDRGPDTPGVLRLAMRMVVDGVALAISGNHEVKLLRALLGRGTSRTHGRAVSLEQLATESEPFLTEVIDFLDELDTHYVLDSGRLVVAHAGLPERFHGVDSGRARALALFGETTGYTEHGFPVRYPWARDYRGRALVVYGHTPIRQTSWVNNTICLDTGCVFGGELTALRYPEREVVAVRARRAHWKQPGW